MIKQETLLIIDPEKNSITGRTKIKYNLNDRKLSFFCRQIQVKKVWCIEEDVNFAYPAGDSQCKWFKYSLNNTKDTNDLIEMVWTLWDYENQQGGYLELQFPTTKKNEVTIYIDYFLANPTTGVRFSSCNSQKIIVTDGLHESKRFWMPCLDGLLQKYPLTLEIQVPLNYYVVSSGEIIGVITEPATNTRSFQYSINTYISTIGFCAAPITNIIQDPNNISVTHFSIGREKDLFFTVNNSKFSYGTMFTGLAEKFSKPFPFKSQKIVFLPNVGDSLRFAGLSVVDEKFMINERTHEGLNEVIRELVASACYNWLECYFKIVSWADYWLIFGLQEYFARNFIGEFVDLNELKFIINKEVKIYCKYVELGLELRPLCNMFFTSPNELATDPVFRLKSGLIFHMIESKVGKLNLLKVLQLSLGTQTTTSEFIKSFKKLHRISLKEFAKNWIYGTGAPLLQCKFSYNKRDNVLDFSLDQSPLFQSYLDSSANKQFPSLGNTNYQVPLRLNMMRFYSGQISIIIYETDGTEIESFKKDIEINKEHFKTQIQCKKKISRLQRDDPDLDSDYS